MSKIITIKSCSECQYTNEHEDFCTEAEKVICNSYIIPDWCPLPDNKVKRQMQWVHVSEKLPDDFQRVLAYSGMTIIMCIFSGGEFYCNNIPFYIGYWMPLPEPPQEAKEGDNND